MTKGYLVGGVLLGFPVELTPHSPYILSNAIAIRTGHATEFSMVRAGRGSTACIGRRLYSRFVNIVKASGPTV